MRQAQAVLNRLTRRPAALPPEAMAKRQAKLVAFERELIERPVLSRNKERSSAATECFIAEVKALQGPTLAEWVSSVMGRHGLTLVPGVDVSGSVLVGLDQEAAALLAQAIGKVKNACDEVSASTLGALARFGRAS